MTDTAPPEQILTEAADRALELAEVLTRSARAEHTTAGAHMSYLAGLIRGGITNLAIAYDRGWDEGYDAAPTPLAAPADLAAVWQGLNDEARAVVCIVSPELAGMLDAAEDPAPEVKTETQAAPPPHYLARLRLALGLTREAVPTFDEVVEEVRSLRQDCLEQEGAVEELRSLRQAYLDRAGVAEQYHAALVEVLGVGVSPDISDSELVVQAAGVIERARRAAHAWAGTGEPGTVAATALQDLVHYLDERAA